MVSHKFGIGETVIISEDIVITCNPLLNDEGVKDPCDVEPIP